MPRVAVAEDHTLVRQSVVRAVGAIPEFVVVGEVGTGPEVPELVSRTRPDILLMDIQMPGRDGLTVAEELRRTNPDVKIVFLTMHDDDASLKRAIGLEAEGFLSKSASIEELGEGLRAVRDGGSYLSSTVARRVMDIAAGRTSGGGPDLTEREHEILQLLALGLRPDDIAAELFLSVKTVKNHLTSVYAKLDVGSAAQAVATAYQRGLVTTTGARAEVG